jgi:SPP1 family predicted phage head-tail adaptor
MRAGKMDRTISIQGFTNTVDDFGTPVETWTDRATLRAQLIQSSTEEFIQAYGASDETVIIFRTRWIGGVTNADRIQYEGSAFNIKETKEIGRRKGLELRVVRAA